MRSKVAVVTLTCLFILSAYTLSFVFAQSSEGLSTISGARIRLISCFKAAQLAESAGANISGLTMKLNEAGKLISDAEAAFANQDFSRAHSLVFESQNLLSNFESEADSLRVVAMQTVNMDFWINIVGSSVGSVAVIIGSAFVWKLLKKKYSPGEVVRVESAAV